MTFLTSYMETMLAAATDPDEVALRQKVLDEHLQMEAEMAAKNTEAAAAEAALTKED